MRVPRLKQISRFAFNRTIVELKFYKTGSNEFRLYAFNRTIVELKFRYLVSFNFFFILLIVP